MNNPITGRAGIGTSRTTSPRKIVLADPQYLPGGLVIDGSKSRDLGNTGDTDVLRAGLAMGKITASGKYAPAVIGTLVYPHAADGSGNLLLTVTAAVAAEIVRRIGTSGTLTLTGPPSAAGTVAQAEYTFSAVNTTTGVITISDGSVSFIAGSFVSASDGSANPLFLVGEDNHGGTKVTDQDDANIDVDWATPISGGRIDASQIINYPSDASLVTWVKSKLNRGDGTFEGAAPFSFDDND